MIYYLDTSALVKRYYEENGSAWVHSLFQPENVLMASRVAYAELLAALARKRREKEITETNFTHAAESFQQKWKEFVVAEVMEAVFTDLLTLVKRHPLRGFDAIHLCTALWFRKRPKADILFACADRNLLTAAETEGLGVRNPEQQ
ncbi:MAG TPA: type II toxin-antitoxin system VapC family toxin [Methylomirabilota bacterium]|nr:type II toxin-antitoxin system VapC family toxin [Methylomirabilota bacterium]